MTVVEAFWNKHGQHIKLFFGIVLSKQQSVFIWIWGCFWIIQNSSQDNRMDETKQRILIFFPPQNWRIPLLFEICQVLRLKILIHQILSIEIQTLLNSLLYINHIFLFAACLFNDLIFLNKKWINFNKICYMVIRKHK